MTYVDLLKKYFKKYKNGKLKYIYTDTTFVPNKNGKDLIGYNRFYNRKRGTKISFITDSKGVAINVKCYVGNRYDSKILLDHLKNKNLVNLDHNIPHNISYFIAL